jgi:chromosome segregation ATPase
VQRGVGPLPAHAADLAEWISTHQKLSLNEAIELAESGEEELRATTQDRDQSVEEIRQEIKAHRKTAFQLSKKKVAIQREINAVLFQWNSHKEIHDPIKPDRSSIKVKTTEKVKVGSHKEKKSRTRRNSKGQTEEYEVDVEVDDYEDRRRPQAAIDSDIDAIFTPLLNQYLALKAAGKALMDQKAALEFQFQNAQDEIEVANRTVDELELKGKDEQANVSRLRSEAKIARQAVNALQSGRPEAAFRSPNFELLDYSLETKALRNQ